MKKLLLLLLFFPLLTNAQVIVTAAGSGSVGLGDGGLAIDAQLSSPFGVALDDSGNLYICDVDNRRIRKVSPAYGGIITTIAGNGTPGYSGDNSLGIYAQIYGASDVAIDHHGNVYIADAGPGCSVIRKITPSDTITTIAGNGTAGYNGDGIPAATAQLNIPYGVAIDSIGNIYIADAFNYRIRKIDTGGIIHTIAGTGIYGFSPDGSRADTAQLYGPGSIRTDRAGNLFFSDSARIRKIDTAGIITTIAGNGIIGYSGDSGLATAAEIGGAAIALDSVGNLYIADLGANRVRKVDTSGIITTIAGNGVWGFYGDNGNPLLAEFRDPEGIVVGNAGVFISDASNNRVRLITDHPVGVNNIDISEQDISIYPNPCHDFCTIRISADANEHVELIICNVIGVVLYKYSTTTNRSFTIHPDLSPGVYFIRAITELRQNNQKLIVE